MAVTRRAYLRGVATAGAVGLAGCTGGSSDGQANADVVVGPSGRLVFDPDALTVAVGDTVTWVFDSSGHNVSARPADNDRVELPEGAAPFASYGPEEGPFTLASKGDVFEHTLEVAGMHQYVCIPHVSSGMVGRVVVEA